MANQGEKDGQAERSNQQQIIQWPAALVAGMLLLLVGSITVSAIFKYGTTKEALEIWAALSGIVGVISGAFVTYFFTQGTVSAVREQQTQTRERANDATAAFSAVVASVGGREEETLNKLKQANPAVRKALEGTGRG
jgi:hypothetical protein